MTNSLELNWKVDGFVDEQRYYCSETPIDPENLPTPKAVLIGGVRTYTDTAVTLGQTYYIIVSSVRNGIEKFSDQVGKIAGILWKPEDLLLSSYFNADDLVGGGGSFVDGWRCRITNVSLIPTPKKPTVSELLGFKTCRIGPTENLGSTNALMTSLMKNKAAGSLFVVFKKEVTDTSSKSRSIVSIQSGGGNARLAIYADDRTNGNMNKLVVGGRRLNSDNYRFLATPTVVDLNTHFLFGDVDHSSAQFSICLDGGVVTTGETSQGIGLTSNTSGAQISLGGGGAGAGYDGHLAACVFVDRKLTTVERQKLEGWAAHKYGLTGNLPANHPYKILVPTI